MNTQKGQGNDLAYQVLQEMELDKSTKGFIQPIQLPSALQPNQVAKLQFTKEMPPMTATVRAVHFYIDKVKYDLGLWLGDGSVDNPEKETRIYNVDSAFVSPY